jgi:TonB-dependent SusC/RagA subfamily outer membrane receptor
MDLIHGYHPGNKLHQFRVDLLYLFLMYASGKRIFSTILHAHIPMISDPFSVLKDPATTGIYGSRGANGVVVITLKKLVRIK